LLLCYTAYYNKSKCTLLSTGFWKTSGKGAPGTVFTACVVHKKMCIVNIFSRAHVFPLQNNVYIFFNSFYNLQVCTMSNEVIREKSMTKKKHSVFFRELEFWYIQEKKISISDKNLFYCVNIDYNYQSRLHLLPKWTNRLHNRPIQEQKLTFYPSYSFGKNELYVPTVN